MNRVEFNAAIKDAYTAELNRQMRRISWLPEPVRRSRTRRLLDFMFPGVR